MSNNLEIVNLVEVLRSREKKQRYRLVATAFVVAIVLCYIGFRAEHGLPTTLPYILAALASIGWCIVELATYEPKKKNVKLLDGTNTYDDIVLDLSSAEPNGIVYGSEATASYKLTSRKKLRRITVVPHTGTKSRVPERDKQ